jgi:hypothetical protein
MNSMIAFDTLAFAKRLREAGYDDKQAEGMAEANAEVFQRMLDSTLATKDDIREVKGEILAVKAELKSLIDTLKAELDTLGMRLTIRLGAMMAVFMGMAVALMKMH